MSSSHSGSIPPPNRTHGLPIDASSVSLENSLDESIETTKHILMQMARTFSSFKRPGKGWIRTWREVFNLSGVELSKRLRVTPARVSVLERDEARLGVTLKTMQRVAEAMDCEFIYGFVPKKTDKLDNEKLHLLPDSFSQALAKLSPDSDKSHAIQRLQAARWRE